MPLASTARRTALPTAIQKPHHQGSVALQFQVAFQQLSVEKQQCRQRLVLGGGAHLLPISRG